MEAIKNITKQNRKGNQKANNNHATNTKTNQGKTFNTPHQAQYRLETYFPSKHPAHNQGMARLAPSSTGGGKHEILMAPEQILTTSRIKGIIPRPPRTHGQHLTTQEQDKHPLHPDLIETPEMLDTIVPHLESTLKACAINHLNAIILRNGQATVQHQDSIACQVILPGNLNGISDTLNNLIAPIRIGHGELA
eukprot:CAMPEP_0181289102 /NCGR_PEP_ID=MMETSP1101-20121128/702_1 /TAXON_ID=46948 /ORGANISM="Rhodomonas abbreviata, Strain Caron Lab Isolate" /LENGTH=192 /DNA_ID=CAMNT_0023393299 /DNA_START=1499 /DNA_END=2076 /DNA_ORIENTATION=-